VAVLAGRGGAGAVLGVLFCAVQCYAAGGLGWSGRGLAVCGCAVLRFASNTG